MVIGCSFPETADSFRRLVQIGRMLLRVDGRLRRVQCPRVDAQYRLRHLRDTTDDRIDDARLHRPRVLLVLDFVPVDRQHVLCVHVLLLGYVPHPPALELQHEQCRSGIDGKWLDDCLLEPGPRSRSVRADDRQPHMFATRLETPEFLRRNDHDIRADVVNCPNCPVRDIPCHGWKNRRYCELIDPTYPKYDARYIPLVVAHSRREAGLESYPPITTQAGNLAGSLWRFVRSGLKLTPRAEVKRRQAICRTCEKFDPAQRRCTVCGCSTSVKPWLRVAECPLKKW
jgi:hypothetical protein